VSELERRGGGKGGGGHQRKKERRRWVALKEGRRGWR